MTDGRKILLLTVVMALTAAALPADHVPPARTNDLDYQFRINAAADYGDIEPIIDLTGRIEEGDFRYRSLMLGGYYRLNANLKVGAFYTLQAGALHDDDWIGTPAHWWWDSTTDRWENLFTLDVSPRILLPFLPGENWVFMLKNRWTWNSYNSQQTLLVRPGLTYTYMRDRQPLFSAGIQYGVYFPLNFSDVLIYEQNPYANIIYHISDMVKIELFGAYRSRTWTTSEDVAAAGSPDYSSTDRVFLLGTGLILRF